MEPAPPRKPLTSGWAAILKGKSDAQPSELAPEQKTAASSLSRSGDGKPAAAEVEDLQAKGPAAADLPKEGALAAGKHQEVTAGPAESRDSATSSQTADGKAAAAADSAESKPKEVCCWLCILCLSWDMPDVCKPSDAAACCSTSCSCRSALSF